ncbi:hypothetical protein Hdeb2414_s0001g00027441 [Helianthus debilis subsp. tardiflorus]
MGGGALVDGGGGCWCCLDCDRAAEEKDEAWCATAVVSWRRAVFPTKQHQQRHQYWRSFGPPMTATYGSGVRVQIGVLICSVLEATQGIGFLHVLLMDLWRNSGVD